MTNAPIGPGGIPVPSHQGLSLHRLEDKKKTSGKDSISKIKGKNIDTKVPIPIDLNRPLLAEAQSNDPEALMALAAAFAAIFTAQAQSAQYSMDQLSSDQTLNNTQAQIVLKTTNDAITKEQEAYHEYMKLQKEANNPLLKWLGIVVGVLGAVLVIATILSGFITGGASEGAVPEEVSGISEGVASLESSSAGLEPTITEGLQSAIQANPVQQSVGASVVNTNTTTDVVDTEATVTRLLDTTIQTTPAQQSTTSSTTTEVVTQEEPIITEDLEGAMELKPIGQGATTPSTTPGTATSGDASTQVAKKGLSRFWKTVLVLCGSTVSSTPMLIQGICSFKLADSYAALAKLQKHIGQSTASQSFQQSIFEFFQKMSSRDTTVATNETSGGSTAIQTYANILGLYDQIYAQSKQSLV